MRRGASCGAPTLDGGAWHVATGIQLVSAHAPASTPTTYGLAYHLFGVWLQALFPLSMAYGISHFHAVQRGVEAAQALMPCLDSWALQVCSNSERSRARCHSSWFWLMGRARSHARWGIKIPSPLSMLQLPLQGCQEFEAHPGRVGVHNSFTLTCFPQLVQRVKCHPN